jgi:hypothetical protein
MELVFLLDDMQLLLLARLWTTTELEVIKLNETDLAKLKRKENKSTFLTIRE